MRALFIACAMLLSLSTTAFAATDGVYEIDMPGGELIYVAGAVEKDGKLLTSGGRVLGVTATADDLKTAIDKAYALTEKVHFGNAYKRSDIGQKALKALEVK